MKKQYKTCPACGAHLDPGESCDCAGVESKAPERAAVRPELETFGHIYRVVTRPPSIFTDRR